MMSDDGIGRMTWGIFGDVEADVVGSKLSCRRCGRTSICKLRRLSQSPRSRPTFSAFRGLVSDTGAPECQWRIYQRPGTRFTPCELIETGLVDCIVIAPPTGNIFLSFAVGAA